MTRYAFLIAACALAGCSRRADASPAPDKTAAPTPKPAAVPEERPIDRVVAATTLSSAFALAKPYMDDKPNDISRGSVFLAAWAAKSMTWGDVYAETNETSFALVQKDPDEERGKRMCVPGMIVQIAVAKTDFGKLHDGLMLSDAQNIYKFTAVGSSGTLVGNDRARFCGIVTGKFDYSNSAGGTGHAIHLVGMFDLPQNKR